MSRSGIRAFATYGMTETCSHVALRGLGEEHFTAMPGVSFSLDNRDCLRITAPGYSFTVLQTNDIARLVNDSGFIWRERFDNVINTGGIKIFPEETERKLRGKLPCRFYLKGVADPKAHIQNHPEMFGELIWRPVDRRENYVKRTIGLPGDRLKIKDDTIFINGKAIPDPDNVQFNYIIPVNGPVDAGKWQELGVRAEDAQGPIRDEYNGFSFYDVPLTAAMKAQLEKWPEVIGPLVRESRSGMLDLTGVFPVGAGYGWTRPDMGEIWIPKRGSTLHLTPDNYALYERAIRTYEGNSLKMRDGRIFINGEPSEYYTFKMDYYWMMGDNRDRSADSRYWGFVPEDHVVGSPVFIIVSLDKEKSLFDGKIRWNRILRNPNPDKGKW